MPNIKTISAQSVTKGFTHYRLISSIAFASERHGEYYKRWWIFFIKCSVLHFHYKDDVTDTS